MDQALLTTLFNLFENSLKKDFNLKVKLFKDKLDRRETVDIDKILNMLETKYKSLVALKQ